MTDRAGSRAQVQATERAHVQAVFDELRRLTNALPGEITVEQDVDGWWYIHLGRPVVPVGQVGLFGYRSEHGWECQVVPSEDRDEDAFDMRRPRHPAVSDDPRVVARDILAVVSGNAMWVTD